MISALRTKMRNRC